MKRSTRFAPALLGAAVLVTTAVMPALAAHEGTTYRANLRQVNDPGAHGTASLSYDDEGDLHVRVETRGLEPGGLHLQHIHGSEDVENRCPNQSDDTNGDGLVDLLEGAPVYGGILIKLDDADQTDVFPTGDSYVYEVEIDDEEVRAAFGPGSLAEKHIVVHGVDVDDEPGLDGTRDLDGDGVIGESGNGVVDLAETAFELTMPALCGEIVQVGGPRL